MTQTLTSSVHPCENEVDEGDQALVESVHTLPFVEVAHRCRERENHEGINERIPPQHC